MTAKVLMVMGTSSSAGKSLLTTALCRCFARRGLRVAPFKSQNMSNNAAVCVDGGEIGRSQALQAQAAGVLPHVDMNPILLKPEGETHSQVIVGGRPLRTLEAADYFQRRKQLWPYVTSALNRLREQFDLIIIEGAGSPAELNLVDVEMVNMSVARYCQAPVLLVGDIERGGVFAQLLGTLWLLPPEDRQLICGLIVNKFRGDLRLFDRGVELLEERGGVPVLGVLPWVNALTLPEEDAATINQRGQDVARPNSQQLEIVVIRLPHIANFDDFDPLSADPAVHLRYVQTAEAIGSPDVVILPGTKNTFGDLQWLEQTGIATCLQSLARRQVSIVGICGGYQMLGRRIHNPDRLESGVEAIDGLGLLDIETTFATGKITSHVQTVVTNDAIAPGTGGITLAGYEIHIGRSQTSTPWLTRNSGLATSDHHDSHVQLDGAYANDGRIWGCYLHGLFHNDDFRSVWLANFGINPSGTSANAATRQSLDRLADAFETHVDIDRIWSIVHQTKQEWQHV